MEHRGLSWGLSGAPPLLEGSEHRGLWPAMFIPIGNTCQAEPLLVILETFTSGSDASGLAPDKNGIGDQGRVLGSSWESAPNPSLLHSEPWAPRRDDGEGTKWSPESPPHPSLPLKQYNSNSLIFLLGPPPACTLTLRLQGPGAPSRYSRSQLEGEKSRREK